MSAANRTCALITSLVFSETGFNDLRALDVALLPLDRHLNLPDTSQIEIGKVNFIGAKHQRYSRALA
jgi:hypothetical protein